MNKKIASEDRICEYCRVIHFTVLVNSKRKYCSRFCANKDIGKKRSLNSKEKRICEGCGDSFTVNISSDHKYCTQKCANKHIGEIRVGKIITPRVKISCIICESVFEIKISSKRVTCSPKCKARLIGELEKGKTVGSETRRKLSEYMKLHPKLGKDNPRFNPNKSESKQYKIDGQFKFNLGDFLEDFDLKKVRNMYHPVKNKSGYVRDHMFSRQDGYKQNVDPKIISHPANCQLITNSENATKRSKSCITLDELLERIRLWDIKYKDKFPIHC